MLQLRQCQWFYTYVSSKKHIRVGYFVKVYLGTKTSPKTMFHSMGGVLGEWEFFFWKPCINLFGRRVVPQSRHEHCEGRKKSENILTMKGFRETFHIYFWFSPAAQLAQL